MNDHDSKRLDEIAASLHAVRTRLRRLTVAVALMALAVLLCAASVFGYLVNWFGGDMLLYGGVTAGAAVLGFVFGWFAGRRA